MAKNRKWCSLPCSSYDVERIESWLQDMARDGWHLDKSNDSWLGYFPFQKGTPQEVRYRLEPKSRKHTNFTNAPDEEEEDLYKSYGWEFVMVHNLFYIYRTSDPSARELNTDLAVQATALKAVKRNTRSILFWQATLVGYWLFRIWRERFRFLVTFGWLVVPVAVILLTADLAVVGKRFLHIHQLHKQLKDNVPPNHSKPWKQHAQHHRIGKIAVFVLYVVILLLCFSSCMRSMDQSYDPTPTADYPGDPPFITAGDILPDSTYTPQKFMNYNTYSQFSSSLAPTIIEWREYGIIRTAEGKAIDGSLSVDYYETASPTLARGLVDDFLYHYQKNKHFVYIEAPEMDADYVVAFNHIYPTVLIQKDNIFICATVGLDTQEENLFDEWAQQMSDMLNRTP